MDVEVDEEGAHGRVLLGDVRSVGVVDADIVGQQLARTGARRVGGDGLDDHVGEPGCAHHVAQDPGVDEVGTVLDVGPAQLERPAVHVVEEEVKAARRHSRERPGRDSRASLEDAREVEHVLDHQVGVDGEYLLFFAHLDVDDALEHLRHGRVAGGHLCENLG